MAEKRRGNPTTKADLDFARDALNASLTLMSILVAVITIVAVEYKDVESYPTLANPLLVALIGTTVIAVCAGALSLASLVHLRTSWASSGALATAFGALIVAMMFLIVYVAFALIT